MKTELVEEKSKNSIDVNDDYTCIFCGVQNESVEYRIDPYGYELWDDENTYAICDDCAYERAMDI